MSAPPDRTSPERTPPDATPPDPALAEHIRAYYTERIEAGGASCCGDAVATGSGASSLADGPFAPDAVTTSLLTAIPVTAGPLAAVPSFGCGQPTVFAGLEPGQTVLDLGSGAGLDAFRAAEAVGPSGRVLGVDMTPAMLARARRGARQLGFEQVAFLEGVIEALPVDSASIDRVISNCVVNLSQDKAAVFREAFRVLRPGGRLAISDVLRRGARQAAARDEARIDAWCACIDGAEPAETYRRLLRDAGFADIAVDLPPAELPEGATYDAAVVASRPDVRAVAPADLAAIAALLAEAGLPVAGIDDDATRLYLVDDGAPLAVAGLESYGRDVLLRSLAVRVDARGRGIGGALLRHVLGEARRMGAAAAWGLTTTIPELLAAWGFEEVERTALPATLSASAELTGACPESARAFRLELVPREAAV